MQAAVDAATAIDVVEIAGETFDEAVRVDRTATLVGLPGAAITGGPSHTLQVRCASAPCAIAVQGLTLTNANARVIDVGAGAELSLTEVVVADVVSPLEGGGLLCTSGAVSVVDSTFQDLVAARGAGILVEAACDVDVVGSRFSNNSATEGGDVYVRGGGFTSSDTVYSGATATRGGSLMADGSATVELVGGEVRDASVTTATSAVLVADTASLTLDGIEGVANTGAFLGAVDAAVEVRRSLLCGNDVDPHLVDVSGGSLLMANTRLLEGTATDSAVRVDGGAAATLVNNTWLGLDGNAVEVAGATLVHTNNLTAFGVSGVESLDAGAVGTFTYGLWHDNPGGNLLGLWSDADLGVGSITGQAPDVVGYSFDGDCSNDLAWPVAGGNLVDAGDPALLDPDGSPSDIGWTGGPGADAALWADADSDGSPDLFDCDSTRADVYPGAEEICDGVDNDCDGDVDADDTAYTGVDWYLDGDGDGFGLATDTVNACDAPAGYVAGDTDCDDADASIHPDADEVCDGVDRDCNGSVDDGLPTIPLYRDEDGDGFGTTANVAASSGCAERPGWVATSGDCNDFADSAFPGGTEVCDLLDNDCNGTLDDGFPTSDWFIDADDDGYGRATPSTTPASPVQRCMMPPGYVGNNDDCDDSTARAFPGNPEVDPYDGFDNDCSGALEFDGDGDGYVRDTNNGDDCDDTDPDVHPGVEDTPNDGIDNDCSGTDRQLTLSGGCACDGASGLGHGWWLLAWLAVVARRSGSGVWQP